MFFFRQKSKDKRQKIKKFAYSPKKYYLCSMKRIGVIFRIFIVVLVGSASVSAMPYFGRVVDEKGEPMSYTTVYPEANPVDGTATNSDGFFEVETAVPLDGQMIVSFVGYEKRTLPLRSLSGPDTVTIVLREQPIALEELVVAAKPHKQRNKRKRMAELLHLVYQQMLKDFSLEPVRYRLVSDVRMDSEGEAWGMEQMIASVVVLPDAKQNDDDSIQFHGEYCKRYFKQAIREQVDTILAHDVLEKVSKGDNWRHAVNAVDSGVVIHRALFSVANIRQSFEHHMDDVKHWSVSNESETQTVLTYTQKVNILGIFVFNYKSHYILDSKTYSVQRFSHNLMLKLRIPFGYKLKPDELKLLNLFNMDNARIEKFRVRKVDATMQMNTLYSRQDGKLYILERNLHSDGLITGTRHDTIPIQAWGTQRVTEVKTRDVEPLTKEEMTRTLERQIVEIY